MDPLLTTLILVLPGLTAFSVVRQTAPVDGKQYSDLDKTITGLLCNVPSLAIAWLVVSIYFNTSVDFARFSSSILSNVFVFILYMVFSLSLSWLTATWLEDNVQDTIKNWVNRKRTSMKRPMIYRESAWEAFFGTEEEAIISVYPMGQRESAVTGMIERAFQSGEVDKGIFLRISGELSPWLNWMGNPVRTYIDTASQTVYEMFPMTALQEARHRAETVKESTSDSV